MNIRHLSAILFAVAFTVAAGAQDSNSAPPAGQNAGQNAPPGPGSGNGQRGGRSGGMGGGAGMMMGRGLMGTVTEVAADHYTIKTDTGDVYTVHFTADKSAAATRIAQLDPAVVQQLRAMEADFGKTWLMGKVTAIDGAKITLTGALDNAPHSVVADENTAFRKRRDPITLADIQVGDTVRAEGAVKDGVFTATNVNVFGMGGGETPTVPRGEMPQVPRSAPPQ